MQRRRKSRGRDSRPDCELISLFEFNNPSIPAFKDTRIIASSATRKIYGDYGDVISSRIKANRLGGLRITAVGGGKTKKG